MKYGFIGLGNMGGAILRGMVSCGNFNEDSILGFDSDTEKLEAISEETGIIACVSARSLAGESDVILLAVKPQQLPGVLADISDVAGIKDKLFISIAAGFPTDRIRDLLKTPDLSVIRVMPNLNASVGEAITAICKDSPAAEEQFRIAENIFFSVGETVYLQEKLLGAFSAVAGASPAFTFMYADALAMAGVRAGIPRDLSLKIALQAIKGSCINASVSGEHPDLLRDRVCSPGGTTIEGVKVLEEDGFKGTVMDAVQAVIEKDELLSGS